MIKSIYRFFHRHYHSRYHGIYRHAKKLFVFDLILLGAAFLMLGATIYLLFWKPGLNNLIDLNLSLGGERIKSGQYARLTVDYKNKSKFKLKNTSLSLHLPEGFVVDRSRTSEEIFSKNSIFPGVKELESGAKGQTEIYGWFWGDPNKDELISSGLSYESENDPKTRDQKFGSLIAKFSGSVLEGELEIASSTMANSVLNFTLSLKNTGTQEIKDLTLTHNWPSPIFDSEEKISIKPGETKKIKGKAAFPNRSGKYTLNILPKLNINNRPISQIEFTAEIEAFMPNIVSNARLLSSKSYAEPGDSLPVELSWKNESAYKVNNLRLKVTSNFVKIVDWKKTAKESGAKMVEDGMVFDNASRTSLSNGDPGSGDQFTINVYLLPTFNLGGAEKARLQITPIIESGLSGIAGQEFKQEGASASIVLATELKFSANARYYTDEGDQLGRGPLPPKVGKTTKYWIFVKILNSSNAVRNASFKTTLPAGVELTGKQSVTIGSQLDYDSNTRVITWQHDSLPANSQTGLYFEVAVTPQSYQVGENIKLTNGLSFNTVDDYVGKEFKLNYPAVTNVLGADDRGAKMGSAVVE